MVSSPIHHPIGRQGPAPARDRERLLIAAWWVAVACSGIFITMFGQEFLPAKFSLDSEIVNYYLNSPGLWTGMSYDSYLNTSRVWSLVLAAVPQAVAMPLYYCVLALLAVRLLDAFEVRQARYHLLAGAWVACSALFMTFPNKETIALPVALWLCVAGSRLGQILATLVFLLYTAFFRQYWAICFFYFACGLLALRLHVANRGRLALCLLLVAYAAPFALASAFDVEPLTEARMSVNVERVDSPDARSAFNNTFENTGFATDLANATLAWPYMNLPVALLGRTSPHYVFFAAFQLCSLWFFVAGCAAFLRDARRLGRTGSVYSRCTAFVVAYSLTQAIFEPDFGSFLRHEVVFMIPMLIVVFYRAHAARVRELRPMGLAYGRNVSAYL
jgi:hypothetical protein